MADDYARMAKRAEVSDADRRWLRVLGTLNEYQARLFVAERALRGGRGAISEMARLTGMSRVTITGGVAELRTGRPLRAAAVGRVRRPGAGRPRLEEVDPQLRRQLARLVEATTAGDP